MDYSLSHICWKIAVTIRCRLSLAEFHSVTKTMILYLPNTWTKELFNVESTFMLCLYSILGFLFSLKKCIQVQLFFQTRAFLMGFGKMSGLVSDKLWKLAFGFGLAFSGREQLGLIWVHSLAQFKACPWNFDSLSVAHWGMHQGERQCPRDQHICISCQLLWVWLCIKKLLEKSGSQAFCNVTVSEVSEPGTSHCRTLIETVLVLFNKHCKSFTQKTHRYLEECAVEPGLDPKVQQILL